jgi:hypothetical protein
LLDSEISRRQLGKSEKIEITESIYLKTINFYRERQQEMRKRIGVISFVPLTMIYWKRPKGKSY